MKNKYLFSIYLVAIISYSNNVSAKQLSGKTDSLSFLGVLFLLVSILVLAALAWWLWSSSQILKQVKDAEVETGSNWLKKELYNLEAEQIDLLMKRNNQMKTDAQNHEISK